MNTIQDFFNVKANRWWGVFLLIILIWHSIHISMHMSPDYLFFVCYSANLVLCIGIFLRSAFLIGTGIGWVLIAFPLWFFDSILHSDWEISCMLFHVCPVIIGTMALRHYRLPSYTWVGGAGLSLSLQFLARLFTDEKLNINAAFRVYDGWEGLFSNYRIYFLTMLVSFGLFFVMLTYLSNRFFYRGD